jgi:hypothetical protein
MWSVNCIISSPQFDWLPLRRLPPQKSTARHEGQITSLHPPFTPTHTTHTVIRTHIECSGPRVLTLLLLPPPLPCHSTITMDAPGGPGGSSVGGQLTFPSVLQFLHREHTKFERERKWWLAEKAELQVCSCHPTPSPPHITWLTGGVATAYCCVATRLRVHLAQPQGARVWAAYYRHPLVRSLHRVTRRAVSRQTPPLAPPTTTTHGSPRLLYRSCLALNRLLCTFFCVFSI